MQDNLLRYYSKSCEQFLHNYRRVLSGFDVEAVHDMRVAVKRIRAVNLLLEELFPGENEHPTDEGIIRDLFRLSGKIRDHQVQLQLLSEYTGETGSPFATYEQYLKKAEQKAIKKFIRHLTGPDAEAALEDMQRIANERIIRSDNHAITSQILIFTDGLLSASRSICHQQCHDEHLHEIRRKLKYCLYLLHIFDKNDTNLSRAGSTLKRLDKAGVLLGEWHDHVVAVEILKKFFGQSGQKENSENDLYWWFMINISERKQTLHRKVIRYFNEKFSR